MGKVHAQSVFLCFTLFFLINSCNCGAPQWHHHPGVCQPRGSEDLSAGSLIVQLTVTDSDDGDEITVTAFNSQTEDMVHISQTVGNNIIVNITVKDKLDCDPPRTSNNRLWFLAKDKIGNEINYDCLFLISDANDNIPNFVGQPYSWALAETVEREANQMSTETFRISATDGDYSGPFNAESIIFTMQPNTQSISLAEEYNQTFAIRTGTTVGDKKTGSVSLKKPLDYETNTFYQFTVIATDDQGAGNNATVDLVIRVQDVQDKPPFFTAIPYRATITENIAKYSVILTITAMDGDRGIPNPVNYTILPGHCSSLFIIGPTNGSIQTVDTIDRDVDPIASTAGTCTLTVEVQEIEESTNTQYGNTSATTDVTIMITDENDNIPTFENDTYYASVQENTPANVPITMVNSTEIMVHDIDQGDNAEMNLTIHFQNETVCIDFVITPSTIIQSGSAMIRVKNKDLLDYEERQQIVLIIRATESANATHTATATLSIQIEDVNDNNPKFTNTSYLITIEENLPNATSIGVVTATDADSGDFGNVTYSISGGNDRFAIDRYNGQISTVCKDDCNDDFDRERIDVFYMTLTATDQGSRSDSVPIEIHLSDKNDNAPIFNREYTAYIEENDNKYNPDNGTAVLTVQALDNDERGTNNSKVSYIIHVTQSMNVPVENMTLNVTTGKLFFNTPLDYELVQNVSGNIKIVVEAKDHGVPPQSSNTTIQITVQDMNDNTPEFNQTSYLGIIPENATSSTATYTTVGTVFATDQDGTERNSKLQYFIVSGAENDFTIDQISGDVKVQLSTILDRETRPEYNITVIAIDQGSPPLTGTTTFSVLLTDVNDVSPIFTQPVYTVEILENKTASYVDGFITCNATDDDEYSMLDYSIYHVTGTDELGNNVNKSLIKDWFNISGYNGTVFVNGNILPDREVAETVTLIIMVEDLHAYGERQTATASLTITLLDINDNYPEFVAIEPVSVIENAGNPTILTTITATDRDKNRSIKYNLTITEPSSDAFTIDRESGVLSKTGNLDREVNEWIAVTISATDNGVPSKTSTTLVNITVLDFNDNAPVFGPNDTYSFTIPENVTIGTEICTMNATDKDIGLNANITFSFEEGDTNIFSIDRYSGILSTVGVLDRETTPSYTLRVKAMDNPERISEQRSTIKIVEIIIEDINDESPVFEANYTAIVLENVPVNTLIDSVNVKANDGDESGTPNSNITYSFSNDTHPRGLFEIDVHNGHIRVNTSLKGHVGSYVIGLIAEDQGEPKLSGTAFINITVQDVNLNKPVITEIPSNNTIKIYECAKPGEVIYHFSYTDNDTGINAQATFEIIDKNFDDTFILLSNGSLKTNIKLDAGTRPEYSFQTKATDKGIPALDSDPVRISINVIDINDNPPYFTEEEVEFDVSETTVDSHVGTVSATDDDLDSIPCYTIKDSVYSTYFKIGENDGEITTVMAFDYENTTNPVDITVSVEDCSIAFNASFACGEDADITVSERPDQTVKVHITDVNDNPPIFVRKEITVGMRRITEVGTQLDLILKDSVDDADTLPANTYLTWVFSHAGSISTSESLEGKLNPLSGVDTCTDGEKHIVCVTGNGSLINNKYFSEDMAGFFIIPVHVSDPSGSDTANVKIYLIGDSQIMKMVIYDAKENLATYKDTILSLYSNITGHIFVYDWLEDHKTNGGIVETFKTDLYFHVVNPNTQAILSADEALSLVDSHSSSLLAAMNQYKILEISTKLGREDEEDSQVKTIYILVAVIVVLALTVAIIVYVSLVTRSRYQRKLQAATIRTDYDDLKADTRDFIPGSNQYAKQSNPLLNAKIPEKPPTDDNISISSQNSIDANDVGESRSIPEYDRIEEKGMTLDMYTEDMPVTSREDPLDAALRLHDMQNVKDRQDSISTDDIVSHDDDEPVMFENYAFDHDLESTEI